MRKDQQILALIRENPFISQQELSKKLGISRSAVAGYISTLTKKGEIVGRAYIIKEESRITCIGGANIDRQTRTMKPIQYGTSNPATVEQSCGGISRNVAENLGRLGCDASLITLIGDDPEGKWLLEETKRYGVDVSQSLAMNQEKTGSYISIMDDTGDEVLAVADMQIYDKFSVEFLEARWSHIASSHILFADSNLPEAAMAYLIERCQKEQLTLWVNPVSVPKANRLPTKLQGIDLLIANRHEAASMAGIGVETVEDCKQASLNIIQRGVRQVIITIGEHGVYWRSQDGGEELFRPIGTDAMACTRVEESLISGILFGTSHGESFEQSVRLGMAAATITCEKSPATADLTADQLYSFVGKTLE